MTDRSSYIEQPAFVPFVSFLPFFAICAICAFSAFFAIPAISTRHILSSAACSSKLQLGDVLIFSGNTCSPPCLEYISTLKVVPSYGSCPTIGNIWFMQIPSRVLDKRALRVFVFRQSQSPTTTCGNHFKGSVASPKNFQLAQIESKTS